MHIYLSIAHAVPAGETTERYRAICRVACEAARLKAAHRYFQRAKHLSAATRAIR